MASVKAILQINDVGNGVLDSYTTTKETNNVSIKPYTTDILSIVKRFDQSNRDFGGASGTPIGKTTIRNMRFGVVDSNNVRSATYKGIDFGATNSSSYLNFEINIVGTDIIKFTIVFDRSRGQYPINYVWYDIDNVEHVVSGNTSNEITIEQRAGYGTTRIVFSEWSLANTSVGITFIENVEIEVKMNKQWIGSFTSQSQMTTSANEVQYGVLANTGDIRLIDIDNELYRNAQKGYLNTYIFTLSLYLNNKLLQEHISNQSPFFASKNELQLQLTNRLEYWNHIEVPETNYSASTTLYNILVDLLSYDDFTEAEVQAMLTNYVLDFVYDLEFNRTVEAKLRAIRIPNAFTLKSGTLIEQIQKVCMVAQLECFVKDDGTITFVSGRPYGNYASLSMLKDNAIIIPYSKQKTILNYDMLVSNRYEEVKIE